MQRKKVSQYWEWAHLKVFFIPHAFIFTHDRRCHFLENPYSVEVAFHVTSLSQQHLSHSESIILHGHFSLATDDQLLHF